MRVFKLSAVDGGVTVALSPTPPSATSVLLAASDGAQENERAEGVEADAATIPERKLCE